MHWPHLSTLQQRGRGNKPAAINTSMQSSMPPDLGEQRTRGTARMLPHLCAAIFSCLEFSGDMRGCLSSLVGEEGPLRMGSPVSVMLTAQPAEPPAPLLPAAQGGFAEAGQASRRLCQQWCACKRRKATGGGSEGGGGTAIEPQPLPTTHPKPSPTRLASCCGKAGSAISLREALAATGG